MSHNESDEPRGTSNISIDLLEYSSFELSHLQQQLGQDFHSWTHLTSPYIDLIRYPRMNEDYHGYDAKNIYTLVIGKGKAHKVFTILDSTLLPIPFFKSAIEKGFKEAEQRAFMLEEEEPKTVGDVLLYSWADQITVKESEIMQEQGIDEGRYDALVKAYVLADKWGAEGIHHAPSAIPILIEAGLTERPLYEALHKHAAWNWASGKYRAPEFKEMWKELIVELRKDGEADLAMWDAVTLVQDSPDSNGPVGRALQDVCAFHTHTTTEKCHLADTQGDAVHDGA